MRISVFYILCLCTIVFADIGFFFKTPNGLLPSWGFQGKLFKNSSTVYVSPELRAIPVEKISKSMSICGYTIHNDFASFSLFDIIVLDKRLGTAKIRLKSNLDLNTLKPLYTFQIEAYDCDIIPHYSERKFVLVELMTIQKPIFKLSSYQFVVKVNTAVGTKIGSVAAFERPENIKIGVLDQGICKYSIISSTSVPFTIDKFGSLITKVLVLDKVKSQRYRFTVQASDCRRPYPIATSVPVIVDVLDDCEPHWTGLPPSVHYDGSQGVVPIVIDKSMTPSLHLCSRDCQDLQTVVTVNLTGHNIRPASHALCRHDDHSLQHQRQLCDVSSKAVDLFTIVPLDMKDRERGGVIFKGKDVIMIDSQFNKFGHGPTKKFNTMFWMRHSKMEQGAPKEQILCNSDGQEHNRHHFSLFLHNCKLILLFRKEFGEAKQNQYLLSEWRYGPLREVCDDQWHHYSVSFNDGAVSLQIDGELTKDTFASLEDKPLFDSGPGKRDTKFSVGACFHAKLGKFVQHFYGHLASLRILDGATEPLNNVRCVATCGEALLLPHVVDMIDPKSSASILSDSVILRSSDLFSLLKMLSSLSYINTELGTELLGHRLGLNRTVTITADIHCDDNKVSKVAPRSIVINLLYKPHKKEVVRPIVGISTPAQISGLRNQRIYLFANIRFVPYNYAVESVQSCTIRPVGLALQHWEYLDWPKDLIISLHLNGLNDSHGLLLEGRLILRNYESILSKVAYVTTRTESMGRRFSISCSIVDKYVTEESIVGVTISHRDTKTYYIVDDPRQDNREHSHGQGDHLGQSGGQSVHEKESVIASKSTNTQGQTTAVWIIVTCLVLVVIGAILGFVIFYRKMKNRPRKSFLHNDQRRPRMKVTPNPMAVEGVRLGEIEEVREDSLMGDVPDSGEDFEDDFEEFEEEEVDENVRGSGKKQAPVFLRIPQAVHGLAVDV